MQFVIIGLDDKDSDAPKRRQSIRSEHIKKGDELTAHGNLRYAAALLNDDGSMKGSLYVVDFPSETELRAYLRTEPYIVGGVWKDVTIHKSNTREPWQFSHTKEWYEKYIASA
jgi:uncharacterized protein YciI